MWLDTRVSGVLVLEAVQEVQVHSQVMLVPSPAAVFVIHEFYWQVLHIPVVTKRNKILFTVKFAHLNIYKKLI